MKYEVHILNVGDADAIVVKYTYDDVNWVVAVIEAGNEGDGDKIKECVGKSRDGRYYIDYAI